MLRSFVQRVRPLQYMAS